MDAFALDPGIQTGGFFLKQERDRRVLSCRGPDISRKKIQEDFREGCMYAGKRHGKIGHRQ